MHEEAASAPAVGGASGQPLGAPDEDSPVDGVHGNEDEGSARWQQAASLFSEWRDGRTRAIDDLVRLMTPVLWHVVRSYGLRSSVAEDVLQTTWLALVRKQETIESPAAVSSWLTTTARREAWRMAKADSRQVQRELDQLETELPLTASAEEDVSATLEQQRLWEAIMSLDGRCQRLLRVVAFDERPDYARIARDLQMPVGSIGPTRQRCLKKVRKALRDTNEGSGGA